MTTHTQRAGPTEGYVAQEAQPALKMTYSPRCRKNPSVLRRLMQVTPISSLRQA